MRQSHDLKNIGSQNPKRLTKVVLSIQHEAVRPSVGLICTTWVRSFGFCDPICFKSWDRHSNMISTKNTDSDFWVRNVSHKICPLCDHIFLLRNLSTVFVGNETSKGQPTSWNFSDHALVEILQVDALLCCHVAFW